MARALVMGAFLCATVAYSQPVTVQASRIPGVDIVGPQSTEFSGLVAQIVGTDQPSGFAEWLPYSVVIRNKSEQALAAVTVIWSASFNGGPTGHTGGTSPTWFGAQRQQIQPGQSLIVMPQATLLAPRDLRRFADGRGEGNLQNFQHADRIEVALDSVVFATGQYVGADSIQEYETFAADLNAPRSVAAELLQKQQSSSIGDIVQWLQTLAARHGGDDPNARSAGSSARAMLMIYQRRGEAALYEMAQSSLNTPAFPLHR